MWCSWRSLPVTHACEPCSRCSLAKLKGSATRAPCGPGRPPVGDAFDLASDGGLRASDLMIGESSRPKDTSICVRRNRERQTRAVCQFSNARGACHRVREAAHAILRRSDLKFVAFTRPHCLFLSAGEFDVHNGHRQDVDQQHVCLESFVILCLKWKGTDGMFCCTDFFHLEICRRFM